MVPGSEKVCNNFTDFFVIVFTSFQRDYLCRFREKEQFQAVLDYFTILNNDKQG